MSNQQQSPPYSVREIIDRYESEEDEFVRELEEMRRSLQGKEEEIPQDPAPIITVLCSLVDEIGTLRSENRHLKTRLAPSPSRTKNMVQRMSAIFDGRSGSSIIPKLRRPAHAEIRTGARERLSTPPRKDCLTNSSISTDFSDPRTRAPPLVEPELSDSDIDENIFSEDQDYPQRSRRSSTRRCDMSLSEYTSPSSASSSREPSEAMTTSRSSIFEILGLRRRRPADVAISNLPPSAKQKKKKRRISQEESTLHYASSEMFHQRRPPSTKPPRPSSYYPRDDSEDSDNIKTRKAASFLNVNNRNSVVVKRIDRETQLLHEKESLAAEIEEMKMRNQRLVEQLREKSSQFSKLQVHTNRLEEDVNRLVKRCAFNERLEKLTTDERISQAPNALLEKMEDRLRQFETNVRSCRIEVHTNCQKAVSTNAQERVAYQSCLEQLERLQRENFTLMKSHYLDESSLEPILRRKLELLPAYETLSSLTTRAIQKISELRWALIEKTSELGKAEMETMNAQANQFVLQTQVDKLRLKVKSEWKRPRRPASFHGGNLVHPMVRPELSILKEMKNKFSTLDRRKKMAEVKAFDAQIQSIEKEFFSIVGHHVEEKESHIPRRLESVYRPESRIEHMMREMGRKKIPYSPVLERRESEARYNKRPISMADVEEELKQRIQDESRRNSKAMSRENGDAIIRRPSLRGIVQSSFDAGEVRSPTATPVIARRILVNERMSSRGSDIARPRRIERGYSTESGPVDKNGAEEAILLRQEHHRSVHMEEKRKSLNGSNRLQRSMPVQVSRIRPPSQTTKPRTIQRPSEQRQSQLIDENRSIPKPDKKSWLEKIRSMKMT